MSNFKSAMRKPAPKSSSKAALDTQELPEHQASPAQNAILKLQSTHGNQAVMRQIASQTALQREDTAPVQAAPAPEAAAPATETVNELSGAAWVDKFPTSTSVSDLITPFQTNVQSFLDALTAAGATYTLNATLRPPQRGYLMHYAWKIAKAALDPAKVPAYSGTGEAPNIDWVHRDAAGKADLKASKAAAQAMVTAYDIAYEPSLTSRHFEGRAIDIDITWTDTLTIKDATGKDVVIKSTPRTGEGNTELHAVGATYTVNKLVKDRPHWSDDGH